MALEWFLEMSPLWRIQIITAMVTPLCLYWLVSRYGKTKQNNRHHSPPSIRQRDPIFGLDLFLRLFKALRENHRNMTIVQMFAEYGHTFQSCSWFSTKVYTIEPKNLQAIFSTDFVNWGVGPMRLFAFRPFVGEGIMCTDGRSWESSRALIKPTFTRTNIANMHLSGFSIHVQRLIDLLPRDGTTVDLQPLFARLALDASTDFLFGQAVGSLAPGGAPIEAKAFLQAYTYGQYTVGRRLHLPQWNFLTSNRQFKNACEVAHEFVDIAIARAQHFVQAKRSKENLAERHVLAYELVERCKDKMQVRNQLLNVFLPAHEAVGVALTNIFFHLARNPLVYRKLRAEILQTTEYKVPWTFTRLKSLKYLQYVINETFRLNPAIGTTTRMALRNTFLPTGGGPTGYGTSPIFIRKGDTVTISLYALHRRQSVFGADANIFRPERWEGLRPPHWSYIPFGGGPRVCPGQNLALTEVAFAIVRIIQNFKSIINRDPVLDFVEVYKITTDSGNGALLSLTPA
ncbi:uncharacterized protein KY384_000043 [Bacidia gigantensis]|uniref:uncharacterized protein n=1 Tax=Bacidia gigantensis TaxID=2732470 RepID=UPI001D04E2D1|nr:uncharacterized protein KY384_000043 [Bacidia gigantensis]KAG8526450.1 hypothetical protein KY384_000043 [Bacidia gigantensis]